MPQEKYPCVVVAEWSVLSTIGVVLASLREFANLSSIVIVTPAAQTKAFERFCSPLVRVAAEDELLPQWSLLRIRSMLPRQPRRAGWYLQQFLKLSFGQYAGVSRYLIWDADTVLLKPIEFFDGEMVLLNRAREFNKPYFDTFERLFGYAAPLKSSVISQYAPIESAHVEEMQNQIESRHGREWIEAVLAGLPGDFQSEFSEYETYGNFLASRHPHKIRLVRHKWLRYGADVVGNVETQSLEALKRRFSRYSYVAFERHQSSIAKSLGTRACYMFGWGS